MGVQNDQTVVPQVIGLADIFGGGPWEFLPGVDFIVPEMPQHVTGWDEVEDEDLDPYETPTRIPIIGLREDMYPNARWTTNYHEQAQWASICVALNSLAAIMKFTKDMYQHNTYDPETNHLTHQRYTFQIKEGWQGKI